MRKVNHGEGCVGEELFPTLLLPFPKHPDKIPDIPSEESPANQTRNGMGTPRGHEGEERKESCIRELRE